MSRMAMSYNGNIDVARKLNDEEGPSNIESSSLMHHQGMPEFLYQGGFKVDLLAKSKSDNMNFVSPRGVPNDYRSTLNGSIDIEMRPIEEETVSTVDNSTLSQQQAFHSTEINYSGGQVHSGATKHPASQGKLKKEKPPNKKMRTEDEEEEIDIDKCIGEDPSRISVKILRKVIPKLRIACYYSDHQVSGKRKLKHLWDEKPADWPNTVPFKDPNNAITKKSAKEDSSDYSYGGFKDANSSVGDILAKKPGKEELAPMYDFLRKKYLEKKSSNGEINSSGYQETVYLDSSPGISHSTSAIYPSSSYSNASYGSSTLAPFASEDNKDVKQWSRNMPQFPNMYASTYAEDDMAPAMLAPTRLAPHHLSTMTLPENSGYETQVRASIPVPVTELYSRLALKRHQVEMISVHDGEGKTQLALVQKDVIDCLYEKLSSSDTRLCLMFLDAGHQFEALLDVMLVLGGNDSGGLLCNGCQEILKKFNKDCVTTMTVLNILQPRLSMLGMMGSSVRTVLYELPSEDLCGIDLPTTRKTADAKTMLTNPIDPWTDLGVMKRPVAGQTTMPCDQLEIRIIDTEQTSNDGQDKDILAKVMELTNVMETMETSVEPTEDENQVQLHSDLLESDVDNQYLFSELLLKSASNKTQNTDLNLLADDTFLDDVLDIIDSESASASTWTSWNTLTSWDSNSSFQATSSCIDSLSSPFNSAMTFEKADEIAPGVTELRHGPGLVSTYNPSLIPLCVANYDEECSRSNRTRPVRRRGSRNSMVSLRRQGTSHVAAKKT